MHFEWRAKWNRYVFRKKVYATSEDITLTSFLHLYKKVFKSGTKKTVPLKYIDFIWLTWMAEASHKLLTFNFKRTVTSVHKNWCCPAVIFSVNYSLENHSQFKLMIWKLAKAVRRHFREQDIFLKEQTVTVTFSCSVRHVYPVCIMESR